MSRIYIQAIGTDKAANQRTYDILKKKYKFDIEIYVVTKESIRFIPEGSNPSKVIIVSPDNIIEIMKELSKIEIGEDKEIIANITTGTKAMVVSIALYTYKRNGKIIYIGGMREEEKVISGSEEIFEYDTATD